MDLAIVYKFGTFELQGSFTKESATVVNEKINDVLNHFEEVILCLKKVTQVDTTAIEVLKTLSEKAHKRSKILFVLGNDNIRIAPLFEITQTTHLFRNDY